MRPVPTTPLDPRIKMVWRINDAIWIVLGWLLTAGTIAFIGLIEPMDWIAPTLMATVVLLVALLVIFLVVIPPIRYARWRFELSPDFLDIQLGIIWRKRFVIPFIRVQNTDTKQGPVLRAFGLSSVTISTAADSHEIPGLDQKMAEEVRDRAAELARVAREDV